MNAYASKKSAVRAAKKSGLEAFEIAQNEDGQFVVVVPTPANENVETIETPTVEVEIGETVITYAMPEDYEAMKPVAFVWSFLELNRDRDERKNLIKAMIAFGYNPNMVKTQTSRFYQVDGDKQAYLAIETAKRHEERMKIEALAAAIAADRLAEEVATAVDVSDVPVATDE